MVPELGQDYFMRKHCSILIPPFSSIASLSKFPSHVFRVRCGQSDDEYIFRGKFIHIAVYRKISLLSGNCIEQEIK